MSLKENIIALRGMLPSREKRFRFPYGEYGDEAELVIDAPPHWDGRIPPPVKMVAIKGTWTEVAHTPNTVLGKQMLRAAESVTGLKLAFGGSNWVRDHEGNATRPVVIAHSSLGHLHSLLPAFARA